MGLQDVVVGGVKERVGVYQATRKRMDETLGVAQAPGHFSLSYIFLKTTSGCLAAYDATLPGVNYKQ